MTQPTATALACVFAVKVLIVLWVIVRRLSR